MHGVFNPQLRPVLAHDISGIWGVNQQRGALGSQLSASQLTTLKMLSYFICLILTISVDLLLLAVHVANLYESSLLETFLFSTYT